MISQSTIKDIKQRLDIVDVMSSRLDVRKLGGGYRCKCPFHGGQNMTLGINQKKQFYNCFKCGAAGDIINFIKEYDGISFSQAVETLCKQAGIKAENDTKRIMPRELREKLWEDKAVLLIAKHDKEKDKKIKYCDKQRVNLAKNRIEGLNLKYKLGVNYEKTNRRFHT